MAKSKFFRAFVAGNTISDGRTVTPAMIDEIVATFNPQSYTPRINVEHIRGYDPRPPFNGYGDVCAVKAQDDDITIAGKTEKRRALYCQVDGNDQLTALAAADQKPFPSVELTDSYAGSGKVGMVGLAFTDSPASIATQKLQFSRSAPGTVRANGDAEVALEFEADPAAASDPAKVEGAIAGFFNTLTARFSKKEEQVVTPPAPPAPPANDNFNVGEFTAALGKTVGESIAAAIKPVTDAQAAFRTEFEALKASIETIEKPGQPSRSLSTGGTGTFSTDC